MTNISPPKPTRLLKLVFTLPRYLYYWHMGWMLGHLCLMMTHIGRKTGQKRQTVLEVVRYDPSTQECIVMSGYGSKSDWYRNIQIQPAIEVQVGRQRFVPQQRLLSSEETLAVLEMYQKCHPLRFRELMRLVGFDVDNSPEGLLPLSQFLRGVAFRPYCTR